MILSNYFYVGAMLATIAVLSAWMLTVSKLNVVVRIAAASFVAMLAVAIWLNVTALLGFAVNGTPPDGSVVYSIVDAKLQGSLYLWIRNDNGPRGYRLPYSEGLARQLLKGKQEAELDGGEMILHLRSQKKDKSLEAADSDTIGSNSVIQGPNNGSPIQADSPLDIVITVVPLMPKKF